MRIAQEEVFGPFLTAIPFRDEAEALKIANGTAYGLPDTCGPTTLAARCGCRTGWRPG
jgi:hypothetical protein